MNAAVWFGAAVFFAIGAGPAIHSEQMQQLLGPRNYPYFGGVIGQMLAERFFHLHLACSIVALLHLGAEWIYLSKSPSRFWLGLLAGLFCFALVESMWLQPRIRALHVQAWTHRAPQERQQAQRSSNLWQGTSHILNLLATLGLACYVWHMSSQPPATRFISTAKFRS